MTFALLLKRRNGGRPEGGHSASGSSELRRILVYRAGANGNYTLEKQIGYRIDPGNRISEVAPYGRSGLLVLEASWYLDIGNTATVYGIPSARTAPYVSGVTDLAIAAPDLLTDKKLMVDVGSCPSLGATNPGSQGNPLMDNYEGMLVMPTACPGRPVRDPRAGYALRL